MKLKHAAPHYMSGGRQQVKFKICNSCAIFSPPIYKRRRVVAVYSRFGADRYS